MYNTFIFKKNVCSRYVHKNLKLILRCIFTHIWNHTFKPFNVEFNLTHTIIEPKSLNKHCNLKI